MHNAKLTIGGLEINLSIDGPENLRPHITRDMLHAFQDAVQRVIAEHVTAAPEQLLKTPENIEPAREARMPRAEWSFQAKP